MHVRRWAFLTVLAISATITPGCERCALTSELPPSVTIDALDPDGMPVEDATVRVDGEECTASDTDAGLYLCGVFEGDSVPLSVEAPGFSEHTGSVLLEEGGDKLCPYANSVLVEVALEPV